MNRFRKVLCVALVLLLLVVSVPAVPVADLGFGITASALDANGSCGDNATYTFDSATGKLVIEGTGKINAEAFYNNYYIRDVVIGDGITEIGADAFYDCDTLTTVDFGNTVTVIGNKTFYGCDNLTNVLIPDSVTVIDSYAFYDCDNLTNIIIPDSVITIGNYAFHECYSLASVVIGDGVTTIGNEAFSYCHNLANVVIGNGVTTIGNEAFYYCDKLEGVIIPDSVVTIGYSAFTNCDNLTSVVIGNGVKTIYGSAFSSCDNLISATVGKNVKEIDNGAFYNCTSLGSINIPKTVTYIGSEAFRYCPSLTDVYYEGAEENWNAINIGEYNTALENATIHFLITNPTVVKTGKCGKTATWTLYDNGELVIEGTGKINAEAFYSNQDIKEVVIGDGITEIGADAFNGCYNLATLDLGNTVTIIGDMAFNYCNSLTGVDIPDSVITIGHQTFYNCGNLTSIDIGNSVITIGSSAFQDCDKLESLIIPDSVITIGHQAFYSCDNLSSVDIGNGVTTIDGWAFGYCDNLTSVIVGSSVEMINYCTFYNCTSLESINIPKTVTYIGSQAFRYCPSLTDMYYEGAEENWNAIQIDENNTGLENAEIHFGENHTHTWDVEEITKYPTCTEKGEKTISCKGAVCKKVEELPMKEHECYRYNVKDVTCTDKGYIEYHCNYCDYSYFEYVEAPGHNFVDYYSNNDATCKEDGTKTATCNRCWNATDTIVDEGSKDKAAHKFENGKCTVCGAYVDSCQHNNLAWYDGYDATCTSEGFKEHYECKDCYQYLDSNKYVVDKYDLIVPKGEHKFTHYYVIKDATCTANAIEKATCDICEEATYERGMPGTMIAHSFKDYKSDGNATCKVDGTMTAVCEMCKEEKDTKTEVDSHKNAPHTPDAKGEKCTVCGEDIVCRHTYSVEKLITKTPTCTEKGQKAIVCSKCKANKPGSEEEIDALGHAWDEGVVIKAATCKEKGSKKYKCNNMCGETKTEEIAVKLHNYKEVITHATCTEDGYSTFTCTMCGSHYVDKLVKAYGHMFDTYFHDEGSATCYKDGTRTSECANGCGTKNTIADPGSKTDHEMTDFTVITPATCTEDGEEEAKCFYHEKCGYSEIIPVEALGHDDSGEFVETKAATCTEKGEKQKTCTRCPEIVATEEIPALGHAYIAMENGDFVCTRCGAVNGNPTPDTGDHTYPDQWSVIIPATCKETGVAVKVCFDCHEVIAMVVPKAGHSDFDGDSKCDTCGGTITVVEPEKPAEKPEEKPCNCDCHAGGIKAFFFKLINFFVKIFDKNARVCDCGKAH